MVDMWCEEDVEDHSISMSSKIDELIHDTLTCRPLRQVSPTSSDNSWTVSVAPGISAPGKRPQITAFLSQSLNGEFMQPTLAAGALLQRLQNSHDAVIIPFEDLHSTPNDNVLVLCTERWQAQNVAEKGTRSIHRKTVEDYTWLETLYQEGVLHLLVEGRLASEFIGRGIVDKVLTVISPTFAPPSSTTLKNDTGISLSLTNTRYVVLGGDIVIFGEHQPSF